MKYVLLSLCVTLTLAACSETGPVGGYVTVGNGPTWTAGNPVAAQAAMDNPLPRPTRPLQTRNDRCQTFDRNGRCLDNRLFDRRFDRRFDQFIYLEPGERYVLKPARARFQTRSSDNVRCERSGKPQPYILNDEVGLQCPR
jgi:hypothetical protein